MKKKFAIILGEPNSINSEIISKSWKKIPKIIKKNIFFIGNFDILKKQLSTLNLSIPIFKIHSLNNLKTNTLNILDINIKFKDPFKVNLKESSRYIFNCINCGHNLSISGKISGFINCAIDKKRLFNKKNIGLTEYLAKKNNLNNSEVMMIHNNHLSVVPITTHVSINKVSKLLNKNLIERKIKTLNKDFKKLFKRKPKIVVLGLNPHNAELRSGSEERKIIMPAIDKLKKHRININGPYPSDTIFSNKKKYKYDVIVGMYHDQVLAPFKAMYEYNAINITLGLKYIRVSPDHGVAKDMIFKNKANPASLIEAIKFFSKLP